MRQLFKNQAWLTLTGANLFESLGISLFNLALLIYAKTFSQATVLVSIVSVATVLPAPLGVIMGRLADLTGHKRGWLIGTKFFQAGLYLVLSQIVNQHTLLIFAVIIGINLVSDVLGLFSKSLRLPLIQTKVPAEWRESATGINQGVEMLMQTVGQALGVSLLAMTHNYQLTGLVNAITFFLAGMILLSGTRTLKTTFQPAPRQPWSKLWRQARQVLELSAGVNVWGLLLSILLMNAVGASIDAILNLFLLQLGAQRPLPFGVSVWVLNTTFVVGTILGSLLHTGWFKRLTFRVVELLTLGVLSFIYLNLLTIQNYWLIVIGMGLSGFGLGQMNPKLYANLMKVADPQQLGSVSGVLSSLSTIAIPIGSMGLVLIYNVISGPAAWGASLGLLVLAAASLFWPAQSATTATESE